MEGTFTLSFFINVIVLDTLYPRKRVYHNVYFLLVGVFFLTVILFNFKFVL